MKNTMRFSETWPHLAHGPKPLLLSVAFIGAAFLIGAAITFAEPIKNVIPYAASPLPLSAVRLTGGPLKHAQELDAQYLLSLEPDRMMAGYRIRASLEPKAQGYGGWDSVNGKQLTGHIAGHYLSAVSLMYAATGDARFKDRADYLVREMKEVQDKRGNGYLGAITDAQGTDGEAIFEQVSQGNIRSGGFDLNGMWSPWYTLHKTFAGLRDAYRYTGNKTALEVEIKFAGWAEKILAPLSDAQIQQMLNTEFGGMNEVITDLYADTGDKQWLDLSYKFEHKRFIEPLQRHQDLLAGQHGNTAIPKLIGSADRFACTGDAADLMAASFFWDAVVQHHTFATGGHGQVENFPAADAWSDVVTGSGRTAESCNVYNMLKLTRRLFSLDPDPHYADFQERALFNHVLASIDPCDGRTCYMVPVGQGVRQEYQDMYQSFTCCVGSGMENHALHGYGIYYESGPKLWVNIYAPSTADWASQGVKLDMATDFPEGDSAKLTLTVQTPKQLTLALRRPYWVGSGFAVKINGEVQPEPAPVAGRGGGARGGFAAGAPGGRGRGQGRGPTIPPVSSYVELKRAWKTGDMVELTMPKSLRLEPTPDDPNRVAVLYGPLVLAGDMGQRAGRGGGGGRRGGGQPANVPIFLAAGQPVADWMKPVEGQSCTFRTDGVGRLASNADAPSDLTFIPFYRMHDHSYGVYWGLVTPDQWQARTGTITPEERKSRLDAATVAFAQPGEMQPERDFNYQSSVDRPVENLDGRAGRAGKGWFSFDLPVESTHPMVLLVTYHSGSQLNGSFEILVNGTRVGQQLAAGTVSGFYDAEYSIPSDLVKDRQKVTVRFQAGEGNEVAGVFGVRMIRADAQR